MGRRLSSAAAWTGSTRCRRTCICFPAASNAKVRQERTRTPGRPSTAASPPSQPAEASARSADGMNEKGLCGGLLWLSESDYGKYDPDRPSLGLALWLQYYLDNFATVKEAVEFTEKSQLRLVTGSFDGRKCGLHLSLTDPTGDTVVIEYIAGKPKIYHGKRYVVMTNSPPYDEQLKLLREFKGFGGEKPLPGTTEAADRFVRGAYYLKNLPDPNTNRECIAGILSVIRNISAPFGEAIDPAKPNVSPNALANRRGPDQQGVLLRVHHQPVPRLGEARRPRLFGRIGHPQTRPRQEPGSQRRLLETVREGGAVRGRETRSQVTRVSDSGGNRSQMRRLQ